MLKLASTPPDRVFRALSDRTRLRLVHLLQREQLCVCDLTSILRIPQPKASRHLAYLRKAGLVRVERRGAWSYYSMVDPLDDAHAKLLEYLRTYFAVTPQFERDARRAGARSDKRAAACAPRRRQQTPVGEPFASS